MSLEKTSSDVKERLTLHVKKRLVEDIQGDAGTYSEQTFPEPEFEQIKKKVLKKTKKKKVVGLKQNKKKIKIKSESTYNQENKVAVTHNTVDSFLGVTEDPLSFNLIQPFPSSSNNGDSFANNCILNEVLSEKKQALLESPDVIEFLQNRMRAS